MSYQHTPVLLHEVIECLQPTPGKAFIDCTLGGGGHAFEIFQRIQPRGRLLAIDWDESAIAFVKTKIVQLSPEQQKQFVPVRGNFKNLKEIALSNGFSPVSGILLDLGASSHQFDSAGRGFSFDSDEILDMRFSEDTANLITADEILWTYPEEKLREIFFQYADEKLAGPIARIILEMRKKKMPFSGKVLSQAIERVYRRYYSARSRRHPATKVFQALRMEVNQELENIRAVLPQAIELLEIGGRLVIISFHSGEDRIVKHFFQSQIKNQEFPTIRYIHKKTVQPSFQEVQTNPRSRSAKLRAIEKIV